MQMSTRGVKMSAVSGVRCILEDIAATISGPDSDSWLNLGAGNPARIPEVVEAWTESARLALDSDFAALSTTYGPSRGTNQLVEAIMDYFGRHYGWQLGQENVLVGPGCQLLTFAATTVFTGPRDGTLRPLVLPCMPDYTGYQGLELDYDGVIGVEPVIVTLDKHGFRYSLDADAVRACPEMGAMLVSNPRNPTGDSLTIAEMDELVSIAVERDVPLVLDHAYGSPFPGVTKAAVTPRLHPNVLNLFTLSKAGLPGERLGFAVGPVDLIAPLASFVSNTVLHAPHLVQATVAAALREGTLDRLVERVITPHYRAKWLSAEAMLHAALGDDIDWRLHASGGGMFCWLWIAEEWFHSDAFYQQLKTKKVCIVPGDSFFVANSVTAEFAAHAQRCIRLSLSGDEATIAEGINRIAAALLEQTAPALSRSSA